MGGVYGGLVKKPCFGWDGTLFFTAGKLESWVGSEKWLGHEPNRIGKLPKLEEAMKT